MRIKKTREKLEPNLPTDDQLNNSIAMGWEYLGDGIFSKEVVVLGQKKEMIGYFTENGFRKD